METTTIVEAVATGLVAVVTAIGGLFLRKRKITKIKKNKTKIVEFEEKEV